MALFACFSYPDRGDARVVYGVIAAFRRIPRGVVSRGQVRTRLRLPLSPAAFLDRLEKGIKTKDILLQHERVIVSPLNFSVGLPAKTPKMDCSDTTQSLQVSLEGQFKKSFLGLSSSIQEVGKLFLVSPQNTSS